MARDVERKGTSNTADENSKGIVAVLIAMALAQRIVNTLDKVVYLSSTRRIVTFQNPVAVCEYTHSSVMKMAPGSLS